MAGEGRAFEPVGVEFMTRGLTAFKQDLRDAQTEIAKVGAGSTQAEPQVRGFGATLEGLAEGARGAAIAFGALAAVGTALIGKTVMVAARNQELAIVLDVVGKNANVSRDYLAEQEVVIKDLGITTSAARNLMIRFMQSELDVADASRLARVAQDLAVISMQDSSAAAESLTQAIVSQRPILLKQFGITLTLDQIYKQYATDVLGMGEATGMLSSVLDEHQKKQAFLHAILLAGEKVAGTYEAAMGTAGKQMRSFSRYIEELSDEMGQQFLPYLTDAVFLARDVTKSIMGLSAETKAGAAQVILYGTAMSTAIAGVAGLIVAIDMLKVHFTAATWEIAAVVGLWALIGTHIIKSAADFSRLDEQLKENAQTTEDVVDAYVEAKTEVYGITGVYARLTEEQRLAALAHEAEADAMAWASELRRKEIDAMRDENRMYHEGAGEINEYAQELGKANQEKLKALGMAVAGVTIDIREGIAAYQELMEKEVEVTAETTGTISDMEADLETLRAQREEERLKLVAEGAEKLHMIEATWLARGAEATQVLYAQQEALNATDLENFKTTWDAKEQAVIDAANTQVGQAQWAASEQTRIAEETKQAELDAMRAAQIERLNLFAFEMLEHKNLLTIPLAGWEDMDVSAQEYYDLVKAGIVPVTDALQTNMGTALELLTGQWGSMEERSTAGLAAIETKAGQTFDVLAALPQPGTEATAALTEQYAGLSTKLQELEGTNSQFYTDMATASETLTFQTGEDITALTTAATEWSAGLGLMMEENYLKITGEWNRAWSDVLTAFVTQKSKVITEVESLISQIFGTFHAAPWTTIGHMIIQGVAQGIREECASAVQAARECAERINAAMAGVAETGSPSKVAMQLGRDITTGLALGIRSLEALPAIEMQAVVRSAMLAVPSSTVTNYNTLNISTAAPVEPMVQDWNMLMTMSSP